MGILIKKNIKYQVINKEIHDEIEMVTIEAQGVGRVTSIYLPPSKTTKESFRKLQKVTDR